MLLLGHRVLAVEDGGAYGNGGQDVDPVNPEVAIGVDVAGAAVMKR